MTPPSLELHSEDRISVRGEPFRIYIDRERIATRVAQLGADIARDYKDKRPIFIGVLNGAYIFLADLMRAVSIDCEVDFLKLSSYGEAKISSGIVRSLKDIDADISNRHVIIVEDIVDTGTSMAYILETLKAHNPASMRVATLLHKSEATRVDVRIDYVGFDIDNLFVLGYGLDYGQVGRNLPDIFILDK
ncbi:MAG: hypoxanthine phosphoribosyltransferase [Rhodothermales bacterium]